MALGTTTVSGRTVFGNKRITYGVYTTEDNDTTHAFVTGLKLCECLIVGGVTQTAATSISGGTATITFADQNLATVGSWLAIGT